MGYFSVGEGYEVSSLIENYNCASLGNGTVVDVCACLLPLLVLVSLTSSIDRGDQWLCATTRCLNRSPILRFAVQEVILDDAMYSEYQSPHIKFVEYEIFTPQPVKAWLSIS